MGWPLQPPMANCKRRSLARYTPGCPGRRARASGVGWNARVANAGFAIERWRAVELQVVFALQDVIEDTKPPRRLVLPLLPGLRQNRCAVQSWFCPENWPHEAPQRLREKPDRAAQKEILSTDLGDDGIGSFPECQPRRTVLIAKPQTQGQVGSYPPLVLRECVGCLAADVAGRIGALNT